MADTQQNILINIDLETGQVNSQLDEINQKIDGLGSNSTPKAFTSIKTEIRLAREEAIKLALAIEEAEAAGQNVDNLSERYTRVTQRAAQLNDAVGRVNESISNANPDNRLQGLISIAQGAATAVQGVAGAFALVGVDAEDAQVVIAKLQGLIALTDSISSIDTVIEGYKDLKSNIDLAAIATKANNIATAAAAAIQKVFTGSVVATGTAFKALKVAIASTGIGLLVVAIAAAVVAIASWISSSKKAEEQANKQKEALDALTQAYDDETREIEQANKIKILQLKIQGASEKKIRDEEFKQRQAARDKAIKLELDAEKIGGADLIKLRADRLAAEAAVELKAKENELADKEEARNKLGDIERGKTSDISTEVDNRVNKQKEGIIEINEFTEQQREIEKRLRQTDLQNQIDDINKRYQRYLALARTLAKDTTELERLRLNEIKRITLESERQTAIESNQIEVQAFQRKIDSLRNSIKERIDSDSIDKESFIRFGDELRELYKINTDVRIEQIELETDAQIAALKKPDARIIQLIKEDAQLRIKTLNDELELAEKNEKIFSLDLFTREFDKNKLDAAVQQINDSLDKIEFESKALKELKLFRDESIKGEDKFQELQLAELEEFKNEKIARLKITYEAERQLIKENTGSTLSDRFKTFVLLKEIDDKEKLEEVKALIEFNKEKIEIEENTTKTLAKLRKTIAETSIDRPIISTIAGESSFTRNFLSTKKQKESFDELLKLNEQYYNGLISQEDASFKIEFDKKKKNNEDTEALEREHKRKLKEIDDGYKTNVININDAVFQNKMQLYSEIGAGLGQLSGLFEKNKKAQVGFALAEIAINTGVGFVSGLRLAQKVAETTPGPAIPFVFAAFYASQVAAVLGAANRAKGLIASINGAGGAGGTTAQAPTTTPSALASSVFNVPTQAQNVRVVNAQSQVVRAFITNEDLRTAQEKAAFLNKLSSF